LNFFSDGLNQFTLSDLLVFWTGAAEVPPMGFPECCISDGRQPQNRPLAISFDHIIGHWPHASTCGLQLWLPIQLESDAFAEVFTKAIKMCTEFGCV
jgi:HECT-domain (ubiquitin-transferase)